MNFEFRAYLYFGLALETDGLIGTLFIEEDSHAARAFQLDVEVFLPLRLDTLDDHLGPRLVEVVAVRVHFDHDEHICLPQPAKKVKID